MASLVVVLRILFLTLITHSLSSQTEVRIERRDERQPTGRKIQEPEVGGGSGRARWRRAEEPRELTELVADSKGLSSLGPPAREEPTSTTTTPTTTTTTTPAPPAELCYLSNGGSSLTLTVNEATPVGSPVGQVEVSSSKQWPAQWRRRTCNQWPR